MNVEVFNVGQGDSILLRPEIDCKHNEKPFLIDCGPQSAKVANRLSWDKHQVLLTHSHSDHIGGFPKIYREKRIDKLILPYYLPEIINISKFIGKKISNNCGRLDWRKINKIKSVKLVGEGDRLCGHIEIFNPPKYPEDHFRSYLDETLDIESSLHVLREYGFDLPSEEIINYKTPVTRRMITSQSEDSIMDEELDYKYLSKRFVHLFFISLVPVLGKNVKSSASYYAASHLEMTANQASIVFKYKNDNGDWLFTGDADQKVFDRLIRNSVDIKSKYLKIPHHGSRENISLSTLQSISPEVAIISHGNRKFGRSKDTHPHHEVIDLLDSCGIRTYYTNQVIKNGSIIKPATSTTVENGCIVFN